MLVGIDATPLLAVETGVDRYLIQLVRALSSIDPETQYTVFINAMDRHRFGRLGSNFTLLTVGIRGRLGRFIAQQALVPVMAEIRKLQVLHSPSFFIPMSRGRAKHIVTVHDMTMFTLASCHTRFRRSWAFLRGVSDSIRCADMVIAPSGFVRQEIVRIIKDISPAKVKVTPFGVDPEFQPAGDGCPPLPASLKPLSPYILFVGTIEPSKNLTSLLDAYLEAITKHGIREHLLLVGRKGWDFERVEKRALSPELRGRVKLTGYLERGDLLRIYQNASVFVCPSLQEGFGLSPLEAMACGILTIASDTSSLRENLNGAAILVPPGSAAAMADALAMALSQPDRYAGLKTEGLARARQFSWENTARKTLACYRELA